MRYIYTLLLAALLVSAAAATPLMELTGGSEATRPFAGRSGSTGSEAAYFNPARLPKSKSRIDVTYHVMHSRLMIQRPDRPSGYDVPESVYQARIEQNGQLRELDFRPFPTAALPGGHPRQMQSHDTQHFMNFGASLPLIPEHLTVGVSGTMAIGFLQTQRPFYVDEREQFYENRLNYEFLGDRLEATNVSIGLAYHPSPKLSLGLGATMMNNSTSAPQIYIPDAGNQEQIETNPQIEVKPTLAPHFGLVYRPLGTPDLEVSTSVHLASQARLEGRGELRFWDFEYPDGRTELNQPFDLTFLDEPLRVSVGLKSTINLTGEKTLEVYGDVLWSEWSTYTDRHVGRPSDWSDTVSGNVGMQLTIGAHSFGVGGRYVPSPVPEQTGRTNYVDNARLGGQAGWAFRWALDSSVVAIGLGFQAFRFLERAHFKHPDASNPIIDEFPDSVDVQTGAPLLESAGLQTNNPGFPGFEHDAWLFSSFLNLTLEH